MPCFLRYVSNYVENQLLALIVCCDLASYNVDVFSFILPVTYGRSPLDLIERENEVESISLADFPAVENIFNLESFGVGLGDIFVGLRDTFLNVTVYVTSMVAILSVSFTFLKS